MDEEETPRSDWQVIRTAVLINLLNPKLAIFFVAFLPQFVRPGSDDALLRMLGLSGVFMLATFVVFAVYGAVAAGLRHRVLSRPRVVRRMRQVFAGTYVAPRRPAGGRGPMIASRAHTSEFPAHQVRRRLGHPATGAD